MLIWVLFAVLSVASIVGIVAAYNTGHEHGKRAAYRITVSIDSHVKHELHFAEREIDALARVLDGKGTLEKAIECLALAHLRLTRVEEVAREITSQQHGTRRRLRSRLDKLRRRLIRQVNLLPKWENPPARPEPIDPEPDLRSVAEEVLKLKD